MDRRAFLRAVAELGVSAAGLAFIGCDAPAHGPPTAATLRRIGYLSGNLTTTVVVNIEIVRQTLRELGYSAEGDFAIEARMAEARLDRLPTLAAELIDIPVDVLMAEATPAALAAQKLTATIPVVFLLVNDPVGQGMVASLARPGGNITGVSTLSGAISGKRLEILKDSLPRLTRVAVLWNAGNPGQELVLRDSEDAARTLGLTLQPFGIQNAAELDTALDAIAQHRPDALLILPNMGPYGARVVDFASKSRLAQMFSQPSHAQTDGGLMAFGPDYAAQTQRAAYLVDKILKGARPGDLPVEQPTQFQFVINLATARLLGLTIPASVLRQATEIVE